VDEAAGHGGEIEVEADGEHEQHDGELLDLFDVGGVLDEGEGGGTDEAAGDEVAGDGGEAEAAQDHGDQRGGGEHGERSMTTLGPATGPEARRRWREDGTIGGDGSGGGAGGRGARRGSRGAEQVN